MRFGMSKGVLCMKDYFFEARSNHRQITRTVEEKYKREHLSVKKAYTFALELLMQPVVIDESNQLATNKMHICMSDSMCAEQLDREIQYLAEKYPDKKQLYDDIRVAKEIGMIQRWSGGHTSASTDLLFQEGYQGRINKAYKLMQEEENSKKRDFLRAELIVLLAAQKQIIRYSSEAEKLYYETEDKDIKKRYLRMVQACKNIAYHPPKDFFEAVQLIGITHDFCSVEGNGATSQGMRIDQLLNPFYLSDIEKEKITREQALEIVCGLWKVFESYGERCANLTIGGCDQSGNDCSNEMTIICMEASMKVKADVPLLTLRVHPELDDRVWNTALMLVKSGQGFPAFYNDKASIKAKMSSGVSLEDAYDYSTLGCVEITIGGREFSNTEEARINWLKILELLLFNGRCALTGKEWHLKEKHTVEEFAAFDELYEWFKEELKSTIDRVSEFMDEASTIYSLHWPVPFLSSITYGCIENASDITENGTKYYNLSINCAGMANTVDALQAIEELVFIKKITTIGEIKKALTENFVGYEWLRQEMLKCSKYGNDIDCVDNKMKDLMDLFSSYVHNIRPVNRRGRFQCGFYTVMHHTLLGMKTAASPDGRYARTSLSNSLSPVQGMDKSGPTSVMNSINKVSMDYMGNGGVLDMKFTPQFLEKENHLNALRYLIETYFEEGGLEVQFNVVSKDTLIKAQKEPEKYGNLVVRVSGYSAYFVKLDRELQNEIIMRTENK